MRRRALRSMGMLFFAIAGFYLLMLALLFLVQRSLIYFPRPYDNIHRVMLAGVGTEIVFETTDGRQEAFYLPPRALRGHHDDDEEAQRPRALWVLFGGNASLALDWLELAEAHPDPGAAFLLVDYPGYGWCEGSPSRDSILRTVEGVLPALAGHLGVGEGELADSLNVFGHSMGAAAAMEFAVRHPVSRVVLVSPYTSLRDMARSIPTFRPFHFVLRDRFDNLARLAELKERRGDEVALFLFHGEDDEIIPSRMSGELAESWGDSARLALIPGGDHNWIMETHRGDFLRAMSGTE